MGFLGSIFKAILSPLTNWIFSMVYGIFIRGPLQLLNYEDKAFQYASGAQVDKLLFNTTLVDGKPQLNFFTSDSPLKYFFLVTLGAAGALLAIFIGLSIVHSISGKPSSVYKKAGRAFFSGSLVFAVPMLFLSALSIMGSLIATISGQHTALSGKNISSYKQVMNQPINSLKNMNQSNFANKDKSINNTKDINKEKNGDWKNKTFSINDIYNNLQDKEWKILDNDPLINLAQTGQSLFNEIQSKLSNSNASSINKSYLSNLNKISISINNLKPNKKDEEESDKLKSIYQELLSINTLIHAWQDNALDILKYESNKKTSQMQKKELALYNFSQAYKTIWGIDDVKQQKEFNTINNLYQYLEVSNRLMNGSISNPIISLNSLSQSISDYKDSSLVVSFYQLVTGNHDKNWDRSFNSLKNGGIMIFMGFLIILAALAILLLAILQAMSRIFSLALLFIVSPAVVVLSPLDDGQRMKGWTKTTIGKMTSIIGVIIILRLFSSLQQAFANQIQNSHAFDGNSGWMMIHILLACFSIGGLLAAYRGGQTISSIVGAGYGIQEGMQMGQAKQFLEGAKGSFKKYASGGLGGLVAGATLGSLNKGRRENLYKNTRGKIGSAIGGARSSMKSGVSNTALATANKMGSTRAGLKLATNKLEQSKAKTSALHKSLTANGKQYNKNKLGANLSYKQTSKNMNRIRKTRQNHQEAIKSKETALKRFNKKRGKK